MIPVTEGVECIMKKSYNDHDEKDLTTTNEQRKVITNNQNSINMNKVNTEINECVTQQNNPSSSVENYQYRHHISLDNRILSEQSPSTRNKLKNEDNITNNLHDLENTNIDNSEHESKTMIAKTQENKSPISVLNQWAVGGKGKKSIAVSYVLTGVTGQSHKPIYTYMCQIHNTTALGEGNSKKEAKRNAAAQMCEKLFDFKINSLNDNDKIITSTTTTDNFEVNENDTVLSITEGSQIIDETNSDISDEELQKFKHKEVQMAHCNMNPIGALSELCTTYKWTPPFYSIETISKDQTIYKTTLYMATCKIFDLQLKGTATTKRGAKRYVAHKMFKTIFEFGPERFIELKSAYLKTQLMTKDCVLSTCIDIHNEENQKQSNHWFPAHCFRSHFTKATAAKKVMNDITKLPSFEDMTDLEQYIENDDPNVSNISKLDIVCKELDFQAIYVCLGVQIKEDITNNNGQDEYAEYGVLVQVTSLPTTITTGYGATSDRAAEEAAKCILQTFKTMLRFTKPATINNNNKEEQFVYVL
ncbi:unnamed protein product [Aphis gossypii]|uniref:DRBM domain-containing protein n=1 Tax=Aphis gossypii TaxID=80765 RepID=A0A9P0JB92_APHGO|nr:unnamed protein product [Aphis gossypii]